MNRRWIPVLLTGLACTVVGHAQTSTSGSLRGVVSSKSGDFLSGAKVTLRNKETGMTRTQIAGALGDYDFPLLPVGVYEVMVSAKGMRDAKDNSVRISLGQTAYAHFDMDRAEASATVEVVDAAAAIDTTQVSTMSVLDQRIVEEIPLVTRNFTDMARLTPGVVAGSGAGNNPRLIVEGGRQIFNAIQIDGASNNSAFFGEQRGGVYTPFIFGADTIKELQVVTNGFDVQYGQAGATVNAVTKTGTNTLTGSALYQMRKTSWSARPAPVPYDPANTFNTPANLKRFNDSTNVNFNIGGPIVRDKLWYFVGVERFNKSITATPNPTTVSAAAGLTQLDLNAFLASPLGGIVTGRSGATLAQELGNPGLGTPARTYPMENTNTVYFGRLDYSATDMHRFVLRVNYQRMEDTLQNTSANPNNAESNNIPTLVTSISWVLESNNIWTNELFTESRLQIAREARPMRNNAATNAVGETVPSIQIPTATGAANMSFGTKTSTPRESNELTTQFYSATTWNRGDWQVKGGVEYLKVDEDNQFFQNNAGSWRFGTYGAATAWATGSINGFAAAGADSPGQISYSGAVSPYKGRLLMWTKMLSFFGQGQYTGFWNKQLTLTFGVRTFKQDFSNNPVPNPNLKGLDQGFGGSEVDPRLAFSYDVDGKGKTVVRGGYGTFTSPTPLLLHSNTMTGNGQIITNYGFNWVPGTALSPASENTPIFNGGLLSASNLLSGTSLRKLTDAELVTLALNPLFASGASATSVWDPANKLSRSKKINLGVEHDFGQNLVLGLSATYVRYENLQRFQNINLNQGAVAGALVNGFGPSLPYNDGYANPTLNVWSNGTTVPGAPRPNSAIVGGRLLDFRQGALAAGNPAGGFSDVYLIRTDGWGNYRGLSFTFKKNWDERTGLTGNLTWSNAEDTGSFERGTYTSASSDYNSELGASLVPDVQNPSSNYGRGDSDRTWVANVVAYFPLVWGFEGSVRALYQSGLPYTGYGSTDPNGDGMRLEFQPGRSRNDYRQPNYYQFDVRLSRAFKLGQRFGIEGILDVYNVFNRADYFVPSNAFVYTNAAFGKLANENKDRTREMQLGLKLTF